MFILRRPPPKILLVIGCYAGLIIGGAILGQQFAAALNLDLWPHTEPTVHRTIIVALAAYMVTMALPFVPGVEIGLALMAIFGARVVPLIYFATVLALIASFAAGRLIPASTLAKGLRSIGLVRAARLVTETATLDLAERRARIETALPARLRPWLLRFPALIILVLFNVPGNALAGGGGGIALILGASRLISWPAYIVGVGLAVSPVPIMVIIGDFYN